VRSVSGSTIVIVAVSSLALVTAAFFLARASYRLARSSKQLAAEARQLAVSSREFEQAELDVAALHAAKATLVEISWTCPHHDHDFEDTCPTCNLAKQGEAALAAIEKAWNA
jgi:hypothetical protein